MIWSYGVTTIPERRHKLLPATLESLSAAGFDKPRIFVDGVLPGGEGDYWQLRSYVLQKHLPITVRHDRIRVYGHWYMSLLELYLRCPEADRFALFQDDILAVRNLRQYLDTCTYPDGYDGKVQRGYWNLFTFRNNEAVVHEPMPEGGFRPILNGWYEAAPLGSGIPELRYQVGKGALGQVFNRAAVVALLGAKDFIERGLMVGGKDWKGVDGVIVTALNRLGWRQYVHCPSLLQHAGKGQSSIENAGVAEALTFPGENFDAMALHKNL